MSDCLIVGGGVIGMMSAKYLTQAGAKVTLIDQQVCGQESSWAGGGIISPLYPWHYDDLTNELSLASQAVYEGLCQQIHETSGVDPQYHRTGLLMMDEYDSSEAKAWLARFGVNYQVHEKGALFNQIAQVRNPRMVQALRGDVEQLGVEIVEGVQAQSLIESGDTVLGVETNQGQYLANHVLTCSGAWSSQWLDLEEQVFPMKGQMIVIGAKPGLLPHIVLDQGRYIIPREDGKILVGSTMEDIGFDKSIDAKVGQVLFDFATSRFPVLGEYPVIHHWAGLRPATHSSKVILGRDVHYQNLYHNTGHFRNGLNMAPESAKRISDLINA